MNLHSTPEEIGEAARVRLEMLTRYYQDLTHGGENPFGAETTNHILYRQISDVLKEKYPEGNIPPLAEFVKNPILLL